MIDADQRKVITAAEAWVKKTLEHDSTGHDWHHIQRVRRMALRIGTEERVDLFLVELMALLHEMIDRKIVGVGNETAALERVRVWLTDHGLSAEQIEEIIYVIDNQSYSKSGIAGTKLTSPTGQVMQDADRLDALGAIGIARCFAYNGKRGNPIHDPTLPPRTDALSAAAYVQDKDTSINHFYEKLLKLQDLMNTPTGRRLAADRHRFMETFLAEFLAEWAGER